MALNLQCIYDLVQAVGRVSQELEGEVVDKYSPDEQVERPPPPQVPHLSPASGCWGWRYGEWG